MQLIVDSGSTKTIWYLLDQAHNYQTFQTIGYNPNYQSLEEIQKDIKKNLIPVLTVNQSQINVIHFYGAGCGTNKGKSTIFKALQKTFSKELNIKIESDLLASVRATCGHQAGISCILGTGSNSALYNGKTVIDNIPSLGYLLGDEGSGFDIGKRLTHAFFYRKLPKLIEEEFEQTYLLTRDKFIHQIYQEKMPNRYLASFALFCAKHQDNPFIYKLLNKCFSNFIEEHILKYEGHQELPIHFIGSIAWHFREIIIILISKYGLKQGRIQKNPFPQLLNFHKKLKKLKNC
ncbi:MAG: hypothetical protein MK212_02980 [Saprospiraceae bacterium]|nr:hypothetical protein [Saprospiraceae bacterium]